MAYVVAEGKCEETVHDLLTWYMWEYRGDRIETVDAFLDLIAKGMLSIHEGKVVPFRMEHVAQATVIGYVVAEAHRGETIAALSEKLCPDVHDGSIERAVRELDRVELLRISGGRVDWGRAIVPGFPEPADPPRQ